MGSTVAGIEDLLRMSSGCGEQNMINFAPNVYVTDYLKATNRLTPALKAKAENFLTAGKDISILFNDWTPPTLLQKYFAIIDYRDIVLYETSFHVSWTFIIHEHA